MNECGSCHHSCINLTIHHSVDYPFVSKPAGVKCTQLVEGFGCLIWNKRPKQCEQYLCLYRRLLARRPNTPESWRPDNLGVMVSVSEEKIRIVYIIQEVRPKMLDKYINAERGEFIKTVFKVGYDQTKPPVFLERLFDGKTRPIEPKIAPGVER